MKSHPNLKVVVNWHPTAGEPSRLWQKLWARLLQEKGKDSSTADNCKTTGGDEGEKGESL